ncbi:hypothetical protein GALMADRAFT_815005 [Galerina marginata CBS 339.88]|uniref:CBM1 domain-containing protein n=1 Tax=Galerina marginata (strain CBS 339.88) TaxID=685588 RepID=A0A067SLU7_GALM3|nr:hypothetical protein GALMADRAFT_815005 [Galerina marginata CBS 339.88]
MNFKLVFTATLLAVVPAALAIPSSAALGQSCTTDYECGSKSLHCCGFVATHKTCLPLDTVC